MKKLSSSHLKSKRQSRPKSNKRTLCCKACVRHRSDDYTIPTGLIWFCARVFRWSMLAGVQLALSRFTIELFFFQVRDSGTPSHSDKAEVTISVRDSNDNPPIFSPYSYTGEVRENKEPEIFLLQVTASDSDTGLNKEFKFAIQQGDPQGHFRIDPDSGNLYVHRALDREAQQSYLLTVRATNFAGVVIS